LGFVKLCHQCILSDWNKLFVHQGTEKSVPFSLKIKSNAHMKKLIIIGMLMLGGCASYRANVEQSLIIDIVGTVVEIDNGKESFKIYWPCTNPPFSRQPCARVSVHAISEYGNVKLGDTFKIVKQ